MRKFPSCRRALCFMSLAFILSALYLFPASSADSIGIKVTPFRPHRGDTVKIRITMGRQGFATNKSGDGAPERKSGPPPLCKAVVVKPQAGIVPLELKPAAGTSASVPIYESEIRLDAASPDGLYVVHAWAGDEKKPALVGKGSFLLGKIILDYPIMSLVDAADPTRDIHDYMSEFRGIGGNSLIIHAIINEEKAYYPSKIAKTEAAPGTPGDYVETFLKGCDEMGLAAQISVSWDFTHNKDYRTCMTEIRALTKEFYDLYSHHPSLIGFYSYQEGSGTYLVPYLREFCDYVKSLNPGLLTSCAPYVDDPLLSGYLSVLEPLDMVIFQGMVMASYRHDNVKHYPLRRVKDLCGVGIGGKWLQDKIAITHTELFGYRENRISKDHATTSPENIYPQLLSAATAAGSDGISFFTYHSNIHYVGKKFPEIAPSKKAVEEGAKAFSLIWDRISSEPNRLAFYLPYADWMVERYANDYLPAFDAFRILGIPADFLPYAPPMNESIYPYYPYHKNEDVLKRLLANKTALILPNVSGFQNTDGELIRAFVEQGGVLIAFGPQIPLSRLYTQEELFGGDRAEVKGHTRILIDEAVGDRASAGSRYALDGQSFPSWKPTTAKVVAAFEDGSAAVLVNRFGKGTAVAFTLDALSAARRIPDVVRDVLDYALMDYQETRPVDILGLNENVDLAVRKTPEGFCAAVVNHNADPLEVVLKPAGIAANAEYEWTDIAARKTIAPQVRGFGLKLTIPGRQFTCLEFKRK